MENKYIKLARSAAEENNSEDAKKYYDMARTEDPENPEAKFYYQFYNLMDCKNGEIINKYDNVINSVVPTIKLIAKSDMPDDEKLELVTRIVKDFYPLGNSLSHHLFSLQGFVSEASTVRKMGLNANLTLAKGIKETYGDDKQYGNLYVLILKYAIDTDFKLNKYINFKDRNKDLWIHKAAREIQKFEPSYQLPMYKQQGGCATGDAAYAEVRREDL